MTWIGGIALLCATAIDSLAVIGRYVGVPLRGSIELMQPMILVVGSVGLTLATIVANHARVRLAIDKLGTGLQMIAGRFSDLATAIFFVVLLAGSGWISFDLMGGNEVSELLGVPWWLMRLFANLCLLACAIIVARRVITGERK
ncbi:TRAP transporter small permease [Altererythrobacter sp.]|uniref:TRAP transporter small permease n=1 Tax=Altererythrobacter sp. TaxID=1872480 RepID=UPI003D13BDD7